MAADLAELARRVIDETKYMALGTADETGHPWVSPVWFACEDHRHFHWVSTHDTRHSRNIAARPEVALAIYDPSVAIGAAAAVYINGNAQELTGEELERGLEIFDRLSRTNDGPGWQLSDVQAPSIRTGSTARLPRSISSSSAAVIPRANRASTAVNE